MWSFQVINIDSLTIRQDEAGRYCLNDLHKAAGELTRDRPAEWLKLEHTAAMVRELDKEGIPTISAKRKVGTFVVKELVYSYAMWISPAFNLKVIRAFDRLQTQGVAVAEHTVEGLRQPSYLFRFQHLEHPCSHHRWQPVVCGC